MIMQVINVTRQDLVKVKKSVDVLFTHKDGSEFDEAFIEEPVSCLFDILDKLDLRVCGPYISGDYKTVTIQVDTI